MLHRPQLPDGIRDGGGTRGDVRMREFPLFLRIRAQSLLSRTQLGAESQPASGYIGLRRQGYTFRQRCRCQTAFRPRFPSGQPAEPAQGRRLRQGCRHSGRGNRRIPLLRKPYGRQPALPLLQEQGGQGARTPPARRTEPEAAYRRHKR